ncbi:class I SAM-dependent methyltransferase [Lamprocystis purpurea]|uniref:class I SAM-dependent methyltransferase n=1 Tax=Lamprocystis purpurea TaxID=61598 RepID=UPI00039BDA35|nr:class I SAM-dependent methyltransferase [Lamprocystis purpurea]
MINAAPSRQTHAYLDIAHRRRKAEKIVRILELNRSLRGLTVLEVGAGSAVITTALAERVGSQGQVIAVDRVDQRVMCDGYQFIPVTGVQLPFAARSFDVVVSNHVLEHVGGLTEQLAHLTEIARVLRPDGLAYLAVPNRWALREPHFGLWFLSWLPHFLRSPYLRARRRGPCYDCDPPGPRRIRSLIRRAGLRFQDVAAPALRLMVQIEKPWLVSDVVRRLPDVVLKTCSPTYPTMTFLMTHPEPRAPSARTSAS